MITQVDLEPSESATCLDPYVPSFESRLAEKNYKLRTIKTYRVLVRRLASFMEARGIAPEHLSAELAAQLVHGEERHRHEPNKCRNIARRFAEHLIDLGVVSAPPPTPREIAREKLRQGYEDYLHRQRGLSRRTIFHSWRFADRFLDYRFRGADIDLAAISVGDVIAFLQMLTLILTFPRSRAASPRRTTS